MVECNISSTRGYLKKTLANCEAMCIINSPQLHMYKQEKKFHYYYLPNHHNLGKEVVGGV